MNKSGVYWCGDHPCINKKEREAFFKETMTVEFREIKKESYKNNSEITKLMNQARENEKRRILSEKQLLKQAKIDEKNKIKLEKELIKKSKIAEKNRIKQEKKLLKQAKIDEKNQIKLEKKSKKKNNTYKKTTNDVKEDILKEIEAEERELLKEKSVEIVELNNNKDNISSDYTKFSELVEKIKNRNKLKSFPEIDNLETK